MNKRLFLTYNGICFGILIVFLIVSQSLGGTTALDSARENFEGYTEGGYYLASNGIYTQVEQTEYYIILVMQWVVGIAFALCMIANCVLASKSNKKQTPQTVHKKTELL